MNRIWAQVESQVEFQERSAWMIYALGGGWGHLNRAMALGRIAARQRPVTILTNSPYAGIVAEYLQRQAQEHPYRSQPDLAVITSEMPIQTVRDRIQHILCSANYSCLIVDTFPRGLGGELVNILPQLQGIPRIFVHRDLNPEYVRAKDLRTFVSTWYNAVMIPGEGEDLPLADLPQVIHTSPWLVYCAEELSSAQVMRSRFARLACSHSLSPQISPQFERAKVLLVCAAGQASEQAFWGSLTRQLAEVFSDCQVYCLSAHCPPHCPPALWITHYPGIEILAAVDIVIGAAGYNTVYECAALRIPLVAFAFSRQYDRQLRRAQRCTYWVETPEEAISAIQQLLKISPSRFLNQRFFYRNGVIDAVFQMNQISERGDGNF